MQKQATLDSIISKVKMNLAGMIQVRFTGLIKTGKRATYLRSEKMLNEFYENKEKYILDSSIDYYDRKDLFFKSTSFLEKGQFEKLNMMYNILPEAIPAPITKVRNSNGKEIGYIMKKINGYTMSNYLEGLDASIRYKENDRIIKELNDYVEKLSVNGIGHGDIHRRNVIIYESKPFLVDPFSINNCDSWYMKRDVKNLKKLKSIEY
ncbi:MAG: Mn2+-dependent serine/threonine protein kinase [Candidatus Parvarchaeum acidiphilum ARMAN-4]|jgi:serine/threonine-protein kinase RIO1|uniref:Mn2+-dependent serine/threonine protein kinase n=1 Tax=Candidatus Parvarchaeum acidiphilum ARMAN-4 TaxID=662760 RepID=D2EF64_PARA4|nr:MAG: Mn2+-dependent serine/threonine protein kinase [Candidatus Parvarchaeum acidiphilum ARMAN-4]